MSGQDGNRGYLIQSVIALLESLNRPDWTRLTLEPAHASSKIDISWHSASATRVCQVKSSVNQINYPDATRWATELERASTADELTLILVGPCSASVARMGSCGRVLVPPPKNLDFDGLLGLAAHLLDRFLVQQKITTNSPTHRELMVRALVTDLSVLASTGTPIERRDFIEQLVASVNAVSSPRALMWELVDFSHQRGIESAIAGTRLGPADVEQCPEFPICKLAVAGLDRSHWYSITGQPGCGKSITAWQAAKRFHDRGYLVWRPHSGATPQDLLKGLPAGSVSLLVVDDAQQFGPRFVERLSELSCDKLKIIFTSTLADVVVPDPSCISPASGVDVLKASLLQRRNEILPIVQKFDDSVSDRYMDVSLERRIEACASQKTPWQFFWVLRGGWRTARAEYESLKQVPHATLLITIIAIEQISSCDAGLPRRKALSVASAMHLAEDDIDRAISHLTSLGLVLLVDDVFRTKHVSYACRIVEESLRSNNRATWPAATEAIIAAACDDDTSLEGVCWLLDAIGLTDAVRYPRGGELRPILEPVMKKCRYEWHQNEWAVACFSCLFGLFDFSIEQMVAERHLLLEAFTAGTGRYALFASRIANHLINASNRGDTPEIKDAAKRLFERIDSKRLVALANALPLDDFYSFGYMLDRLAFYRPSWSGRFLENFDWPRVLTFIVNADTSHAEGVDKLVTGLSFLASRNCDEYNLQYIRDIVPFIIRAINDDPINTINLMDGVFWHCLGFGPRFLRAPGDPDEEQFQIAEEIVAKLNPVDFAKVMSKVISRDMESLARSLAVIHEVDPEFIRNVASLVSENEFLAATRTDWRLQSEELMHLLRFFSIGEECQPARNWISRNAEIIEGPLEPVMAGIAPQVAIEFHKAGRRVSLIGRGQHRWNETGWAIFGIARVDKDVCVEIVNGQLEELEAKLYSLSLDSPRYIVNCFRLIHELSEELFLEIVDRVNLDDPRAATTIDRLRTSQRKQRISYRTLARLACRYGGRLGSIGERLLSRLDEEVRGPDER